MTTRRRLDNVSYTNGQCSIKHTSHFVHKISLTFVQSVVQEGELLQCFVQKGELLQCVVQKGNCYNVCTERGIVTICRTERGIVTECRTERGIVTVCHTELNCYNKMQNMSSGNKYTLSGEKFFLHFIVFYYKTQIHHTFVANTIFKN